MVVVTCPSCIFCLPCTNCLLSLVFAMFPTSLLLVTHKLSGYQESPMCSVGCGSVATGISSEAPDLGSRALAPSSLRLPRLPFTVILGSWRNHASLSYVFSLNSHCFGEISLSSFLENCIELIFFLILTEIH